jgi:hypothetical protein
VSKQYFERSGQVRGLRHWTTTKTPSAQVLSRLCSHRMRIGHKKNALVLGTIYMREIRQYRDGLKSTFHAENLSVLHYELYLFVVYKLSDAEQIAMAMASA